MVYLSQVSQLGNIETVDQRRILDHVVWLRDWKPTAHPGLYNRPMLFEMDADILVLLSRFNPDFLDPALFDAQFDPLYDFDAALPHGQIPSTDVHQSKSSRWMLPLLPQSVFASSLPGSVSETMAEYRDRRLRRYLWLLRRCYSSEA